MPLKGGLTTSTPVAADGGLHGRSLICNIHAVESQCDADFAHSKPEQRLKKKTTPSRDHDLDCFSSAPP